MTNEIGDEVSNTAVNTYRIEQLEKQLEALRSSTETLNFEQIKQMGLWLGLPVAVATGVFGLALWQTIETSAGNRAAEEVQIIAEDIKSLETLSAKMAQEAEARFGDLREIAGRADEAARGVFSRADDARIQATEAERLLTRMREELAGVPEVQSLLQDTGNIASDLAGNRSFQVAVAGTVLDSLAGSVVAFDRECPTELGWVPFDLAQGRMIVGVGSTMDDRGETRGFARATLVGGEFQHKLEVSEMPSHRHGLFLSLAEGPNRPLFYYNSEGANNNRIASNAARGGSDVLLEGGSKPHNNMPPYIALHFCRKETG